MENFSIKNRKIGRGHPCFIIAEVAQSHDGSLGLAHSFIEAAAEAGADAVKFQTHIAEAESSRDEQFRVKFSYEDRTRYDYWKRMEFTAEQWAGLSEHAVDKGIIFLSSPFSLEAVDLLQAIGMPAWKIGSGEVNNRTLLEKVVKTSGPVLVSSGMSGWDELSQAVDFVKGSGNPLALFQCTSQYPVPLRDIGVNVMEEMGRRFGVPVGLSDHSASVYPLMLAMARGASLLEFHVAFHKGMFGPDVSASLTFEQLSTITGARDAFFEMEANPVDKDAMAEKMSGMRALFNRSLALKTGQLEGTVIGPEMLTAKKPGNGISPDRMREIVGRRLSRDVPSDRLLVEEDFKA